jgi:hypothetical protein
LLSSDLESIEYEGAIKGSGGSRDDDSSKGGSKRTFQDGFFGGANTSNIDLSRFERGFAQKPGQKVTYDEKTNFQFPENQMKSQEDEGLVRRVRNNDFLERFKMFGDTFRTERQGFQGLLPGGKPIESKLGNFPSFTDWDIEGPKPRAEDHKSTEMVPEISRPTFIAHETNQDTHKGNLRDHLPMTAEKKQSSTHPLADMIEADLHQIIKKSTETSMSKSKMLERKAEIEKQLASSLKMGKDSPQMQHNSNTYPQITHPEPTIIKVSDSNKASPVRFEEVHANHKPVSSRVRSRASQGLLNFLSQEIASTENTVDMMENLRPSGDLGHKPTSMELLAEKPIHLGEPEVTHVDKRSIDEVEMEADKRSRKSYFPEKLLKKVKIDQNQEEETEEEAFQNLAQQFKGPFFNMFSHGASNVGLQNLFGGLGLGREDTYSLARSSGVLEELIDLKDDVKNLHIESLKEFGEKLADERRANIDMLEIEKENFHFNDINFDRNSFEEVMMSILKQKLLICFDMASRQNLLNIINKELDQKIKFASELKTKIESVELPKAEELNGEWTEQRLFNKISKEYNFQYFKYSLQRETGQIDVTFAMDDVLFFSLHFDRLTQSETDTYYIQTGTCKHSPIVVAPPQKTLNPLNNPQVLANIYGRIIATSANDNEPSDALNFLVYLGCEQLRLNTIRRSLNLSVAKHKISDIVIDLHTYVIHFLMFPKIAKVNFSLKVSTSLLVSESANVFVEILSSQHKKKNIKNEVFSDLDDKIRLLLENYPAAGQDWLIEIVDKLAEIINQDF